MAGPIITLHENGCKTVPCTLLIESHLAVRVHLQELFRLQPPNFHGGHDLNLVLDAFLVNHEPAVKRGIHCVGNVAAARAIGVGTIGRGASVRLGGRLRWAGC